MNEVRDLLMTEKGNCCLILRGASGGTQHTHTSPDVVCMRNQRVDPDLILSSFIHVECIHTQHTVRSSFSKGGYPYLFPTQPQSKLHSPRKFGFQVKEFV